MRGDFGVGVKPRRMGRGGRVGGGQEAMAAAEISPIRRSGGLVQSQNRGRYFDKSRKILHATLNALLSLYPKA